MVRIEQGEERGEGSGFPSSVGCSRGRRRSEGANKKSRIQFADAPLLAELHIPSHPHLSLGCGTEKRRILIRRAGLEPRMSGKGGNWFGYRLVGRLLFSHLRTGSDDGSAKSSFLPPIVVVVLRSESAKVIRSGDSPLFFASSSSSCIGAASQPARPDRWMESVPSPTLFFLLFRRHEWAGLKTIAKCDLLFPPPSSSSIFPPPFLPGDRGCKASSSWMERWLLVGSAAASSIQPLASSNNSFFLLRREPRIEHDRQRRRRRRRRMEDPNRRMEDRKRQSGHGTSVFRFLAASQNELRS